MIFVSHKQRRIVDYLISQSLFGYHPLFDMESMRKAASLRHTEEESYRMEPYLDRLISYPTLFEQKAYLAALSPDQRIGLVRTYLNVVENELLFSGVIH